MGRGSKTSAGGQPAPVSRRRAKSVTGAASTAADMLLQRGRGSASSNAMAATPTLTKRKKHLRVKILPNSVKVRPCPVCRRRVWVHHIHCLPCTACPALSPRRTDEGGHL